MGRVMTSSSVGLLEVRFYVAQGKKLGVKFYIKELKYAADLVASIKMSLNIKNKIKSYPRMMRFLYSGNHVNDDRCTRRGKIINAA